MHLVWSLTYVILMEVTVESRRGLTGGVVQIGWNIGAMLMTFSAFALRSWHWMQLANAVFSLLLVLYYILVPGLVLVVYVDTGDTGHKTVILSNLHYPTSYYLICPVTPVQAHKLFGMQDQFPLKVILHACTISGFRVPSMVARKGEA